LVSEVPLPLKCRAGPTAPPCYATEANLQVQQYLLLIINTSYQENALPAIHIKIHHTSYKIL